MQYNRSVSVQNKIAVYGFMQLPKPSIDTGMGLERLAAVLQGVISNYETDLFTPLIDRAAELMSTTVLLTKIVRQPEHTAASLRVIADHSRAMTFLISDGVLPSNEGRGYVLRKIIRRAILHGRKGYAEGPFLHQMVYSVVDLMKDAYPELVDGADRVAGVVKEEETRFTRTLEVGLEKLEQDFQPLRAEKFLAEHPSSTLEVVRKMFGERVTAADWGSIAPSLRPIYRGDKAFRLYDTFGLPRDFIEDACRDNGFVLDEAGFDRAMAEQRERARASWKGAAKQTANPTYQQLPKSDFEGYRQTRSDNCEVLAIIKGNQGAQELKPGESGEIILDHTPFYAESGGQVGDRGWLYSDDHNTVVAEVTGCYYPVQGVRAHQVVMKSPPSAKNAEGWGSLHVGDKVDAVVDAAIREATMRNHTATHLLHAGLREVLGKHVKQAGSLVAPNHLRFDFSHFTGVEDEELQDIEDIINKEVLRNERVEIVENVPIDVAVNEYHAMALFGEKYGDKVRVIKIGDFSTELCGGTHTGATGEIGLIKILKEGSVSSGVRRIEAVTGEGSLRHFRKDHELEGVVTSFAGPTLSQRTRKDGAPAESPAEALRAELEKRDSEIKRLTRELDQARMKSASSAVASVGDKVKEVRGVKVLAHRVDNLERAQLRTLVDQLREKLGSGVVVVGSAANGNVSLIAGVTKDLTSRIQAGKVVGAVAAKVGGKGGGRPDLAEAGGKDAAALDSALDSVYNIVKSLLG
jgi:alanyl-tRNA synthetase